MTLPKAEKQRRRITASERQLQEAKNTAYRSLIDLYLVAESHAQLMDGVAAEQEKPVQCVGYRKSYDGKSWWPGAEHCNAVVQMAMATHQVIGTNPYQLVRLPLIDRSIPLPDGVSDDVWKLTYFH